MGKIDACGRFCYPKGLRVAQGAGNKLWAADRSHVVLYKDNAEQKRVRVGETVFCLSGDGGGDTAVLAGTEDGRLFSYDPAADEATRLPVEFPGEEIFQVEEAGNKKLAVWSWSPAACTLTAVSMGDRSWTKNVIVKDRWHDVGYFSVASGNIVVFGQGNKIKFAPM